MRPTSISELFKIWFDELKHSAIGLNRNPNFDNNYYLTLPNKSDIIRHWKQSNEIYTEVIAGKIDYLLSTTQDYIEDYEKEIKELKSIINESSQLLFNCTTHVDNYTKEEIEVFLNKLKTYLS